MATEAIKYQNQERNVELPSKGNNHSSDELLIEIAKVFILLADLHSKGIHHWPEDENPLQLCMDCLQETANKIEPQSMAACMALAVTSAPEWQDNLQSTGIQDRMEGKAIATATQLILEQ